jgi:hypothetical protein
MRSSLKTGLIASMVMVMGVFAVPGVGQASTSTDYPVTGFHLTYGASVLTGSITWYNRAVRIPGSIRARSSDKHARFRGESANCYSPLETRYVAVDDERPFVVEMNCDYPGGFTKVLVGMFEGNTDTLLRAAVCTRQGCVNK